ncbi:hypothetical protein IGI04_011378 [Brassica rapa subsp. trilocularis]|uniref:Remorin C-terminal domain-containing protein n=1 Tax=Brassica rapa subsp. trilocularis TaxID=1813537 RepID=A0ABQ7N2W0_BRACM|nr:uncharacterized protein At3g61260 [Brassica rapa]KAG5405259.1 hypothetical protein IGI04_011378 [Brassica rapa subsp. trilocularis]
MESGKAQLSVINAWKEQKITKVTNKTEKKLLEISSWEKKQTTKIESQLANTQRKMDSKKKEKAEKLRRNKAAVHAKAQEKKARVQTRRAQEILDAEDEAATFQATGQIPNKSSCSCF